MANHKSAIKRARQNEKKRLQNKSSKTRIKNIVKVVRQTVSEKSNETALAELNIAKSIIDNAAKKGVIHRKTASRKISRLSRLVNTMST
ncbi:MAG: small subunit ribosomal protein S20 [Desulfobacteraceae bacterium Eth-SRB2]|nr:MAG: small subunit ribosomal protein S20 [Desulfobacteraceae bacterium Eth-SRB2]